MFTTYDALKLPVLAGDGSSTWTAVELEMSAPWFVARLRDDDNNLHRTFLLPDAEEVVTFASQRIAGMLTQLHLVLPPAWSPSGEWKFIRISRIERALAAAAKNAGPSTLVAAADGTRYGGFPAEPVVCHGEPLVTLFELADS